MLKLQTKAFSCRKDIINSYWQEVQQYHNQLHNGTLDMTGWVRLPLAENLPVEEYAAAGAGIAKNYNALVVIGIGGSYLGTRSCYQALEDSCTGVKLFFAGWNFGAGYHRKLIRELDSEKEVALCVVSKSGSTAETSLAFELLKEYVAGRYGKGWEQRVYAITDSEKGILREEALAKGYHLFSLPGDIGGRYSVLSSVGLLPLAAAGLDIQGLIKGSRMAYEDTDNGEISQNICYQYAVYRNLMTEENKTNEVFSFVDPELGFFGNWLVQLFAESEGKNHKGIYPTVLQYSTDLHSVGQFMEEGTPCCFETMITGGDLEEDLCPGGSGHSYNDYRNAVAGAMYKVRNDNGTPFLWFKMDAMDEENLGYMIYFFEKACAMSCLLRGVNPFNQPGVEAYKREMRKLLSC